MYEIACSKTVSNHNDIVKFALDKTELTISWGMRKLFFYGDSEYTNINRRGIPLGEHVFLKELLI